MEATPALRLVNSYYDEELFGGYQLQDKIGFFNVGLWKDDCDSIEMAQLILLETLVRFFESSGSTVLDVACGKGASTKYLTKYFSGKRITGINISEMQLEVCRVMAPECDFRLMDATRMAFSDATFHNILCVEAAFHFVTRHGFLQEAFRVLVEGGRLAMSDMLFGRDAENVTPTLFPVNAIEGIEEYRSLLLEVGFRKVRIEDTTRWALLPLLDHMEARIEKDLEFVSEIERNRLREECRSFRKLNPVCCNVFAIK